MITLLVRYEIYVNAAHAMRDGHWTTLGQIVEVENFIDLNEKFGDRIVDVKILKER